LYYKQDNYAEAAKWFHLAADPVPMLPVGLNFGKVSYEDIKSMITERRHTIDAVPRLENISQ
jgi:hypothetical protein